MDEIFKLRIDSGELEGIAKKLTQISAALKSSSGGIGGAVSAATGGAISSGSLGSTTKSISDFNKSMQAVNGHFGVLKSKIATLFGPGGLLASGLVKIGTSVVSVIKKVWLTAVGAIAALASAAFGIAKGTTAMMGEASLAKLNFAKQKAYKGASEHTGISPDFVGLQRRLLEGGALDESLAKLGISADRIKELRAMEGDEAYFSLFKELRGKYDSMKKSGMDTSVINSIFGDALQNTLGMGVLEFENMQKPMQEFQSMYSKLLSTWGGSNIDVSALQNGERALTLFWNKLQAIATQLAGEFLPILTEALNDIMKWLGAATKSEEFKEFTRLFKSIASDLLIIVKEIAQVLQPALKPLLEIIQKLVKAIAHLTKGEFSEALKTFGSATSSAANAAGGAVGVLTKPVEQGAVNLAENAGKKIGGAIKESPLSKILPSDDSIKQKRTRDYGKMIEKDTNTQLKRFLEYLQEKTKSGSLGDKDALKEAAKQYRLDLDIESIQSEKKKGGLFGLGKEYTENKIELTLNIEQGDGTYRKEKILLNANDKKIIERNIVNKGR